MRLSFFFLRASVFRNFTSDSSSAHGDLSANGRKIEPVEAEFAAKVPAPGGTIF
jgi:hypothetical protein